MRYFLLISYKGTGYSGWQEQRNSSNTIQQICSKAVSQILKHPVSLTGAGRTDAGVNAEMYYAHFDSAHNDLVEEKYKWLYKFNSVTPFTIAFNGIYKVSDKAHARYDATSRTYRYDITLKKNPFLYGNALYFPYPVNIQKMNQAASRLHDYKSFSSFKKLGAGTKTDYCVIKKAIWEMQEDKLTFTITADRFLRNMVRAIVGTMLNVGSGKINVEDFCRIIESKDRSRAGASVLACGLYLTNIEYTKDVFIE